MTFINNIIAFFVFCYEYVAELVLAEIGSLAFWQILLLVGLVLSALLILASFFKLLKIIFLAIRKSLKTDRAKEKCQKITCKTCGRSLAACICQKNSGLSYKQRLKNYKE